MPADGTALPVCARRPRHVPLIRAARANVTWAVGDCNVPPLSCASPISAPRNTF